MREREEGSEGEGGGEQGSGRVERRGETHCQIKNTEDHKRAFEVTSTSLNSAYGNECIFATDGSWAVSDESKLQE